LKGGKSSRFAVGHLALGYILGKTSSKLLKTRINLPLIFTLSVISDADILLQHFGLIQHRGPTHSIVLTIIVFAPVLIIYRKKAVPYLVALASHTLIGDFLLGGQFQLFWPVTTQRYGIGLNVTSQAGITLELTVFLASLIIMIATRDLAALLKPRASNLILAIPTFTVILPTFLSYPIQVPTWLITPHVIYLVMFSTSILIAMPKIIKNICTKLAGA
jgi:membrane-bound metal-dependent hydrolase YbcI (DUF457 family)